MKKVVSSEAVSACTQRVAAIGKYLAAKDVVFVNGEEVEASDLGQVFQDALDTRDAVVKAMGAYKAALATRAAAEARRLIADAALQPYVTQRFGAGSAEANAFGYTPRKVGEKTVATKARALLLNKATREARGTVGKKEKRRIKGSLSAEEVAALRALVGRATGGAGDGTRPVEANEPAVASALGSAQSMSA
jgi:hypothetical protein